MKKLVSILFLICASAALCVAQEETARNTIASDSSDDIATPETPGHYTPVLKNTASFTDENAYPLRPDQLPASLRGTLEGAEYQGWEEGTILRHLLTGEYRIEIANGTEKKIFMFNTYGERIPDE